MPAIAAAKLSRTAAALKPAPACQAGQRIKGRDRQEQGTDKKHAPNPAANSIPLGGDDFDFRRRGLDLHLGGRDRGWPWRTVAALRTFPCPCRSALPACLSTGPTEKPPVGTLLLRALQLSVACCFKKR